MYMYTAQLAASYPFITAYLRRAIQCIRSVYCRRGALQEVDHRASKQASLVFNQALLCTYVRGISAAAAAAASQSVQGQPSCTSCTLETVQQPATHTHKHPHIHKHATLLLLLLLLLLQLIHVH